MGFGSTAGLDWRQGQKVSAKKLNRMIDLIGSAIPGLNLVNPQFNHPSGHATTQLDKYRGVHVFCRVVSNRTTGGEYNVTILRGPVSTTNASTFTTDDFNDDLPAVLQNIAEEGNTDHALAVDQVLEATVVGRTGEDDKAILLLRSGGVASLPKGQYQYMVCQMVTQNQVGYDYVRAAPLMT